MSALVEKRDAMFAGEKINITEGPRRAAHGAAQPDRQGRHWSMARMSRRTSSPCSTPWAPLPTPCAPARRPAPPARRSPTSSTSASAAPISARPWRRWRWRPIMTGRALHYVSNIDGAHIHDTLKGLLRRNHAFHHRLQDLHHRRDDDQCADGARLGAERRSARKRSAKHFCRRLDRARPRGQVRHRPDRVFGFWDWVGGRYSLWGDRPAGDDRCRPENFRAFLDGAHEMDEHFRTAPVQENLPMLLGLVGWWHRVCCGYPARAVFPTTSACPACRPICSSSTWNRTARASRSKARRSTTPTGPLVWGEPGTNGQHAFFQLLHQGTDFIPVEFLAAANRPRARSQAPA
jgi:glucose-6-phosphate isomerase